MSDEVDEIGCSHPSWLDHKCASCAAKIRVRERIRALEVEVARWQNGRTEERMMYESQLSDVRAERDALKAENARFREALELLRLDVNEVDRFRTRAEKAEALARMLAESSAKWLAKADALEADLAAARERLLAAEKLLGRAIGFGLGGSWEHEAADLLSVPGGRESGKPEARAGAGCP